jgi:hypothetical protein
MQQKSWQTKTSEERKTTINSYLVFGADLGEERGANDDNVVESTGNVTRASKKYSLTKIKD